MFLFKSLRLIFQDDLHQSNLAHSSIDDGHVSLKHAVYIAVRPLLPPWGPPPGRRGRHPPLGGKSSLTFRGTRETAYGNRRPESSGNFWSMGGRPFRRICRGWPPGRGVLCWGRGCTAGWGSTARRRSAAGGPSPWPVRISPGPRAHLNSPCPLPSQHLQYALGKFRIHPPIDVSSWMTCFPFRVWNLGIKTRATPVAILGSSWLFRSSPLPNDLRTAK